MKTILWMFLLLEITCNVESYRILFVFPSSVRSHYILGRALAKGLTEVGHDVTMLSPFEENIVTRKGKYRDVVLTGLPQMLIDMKMPSWLEIGQMNPAMQDIIPMHTGHSIVNFTFNHPNFQKLIRSPRETFDVIILEVFLNDAFKVLSCHFDAPVILFSTLSTSFWINSLNGNPSPPSYIPDFFQPYSTKMTLWQRTLNSWYILMRYLSKDYLDMPKQLKYVKEHFPECYKENLHYTSSLTLVNHHESINFPVPMVPTMIPIGGLHINPSSKLPEDLQEYLDGADEEGVIYFSLGTNVLFSLFDNRTKEIIFRCLGERKEKILLTCDEDPPFKPNNILIKKWSPQQNILAHPKVKLFVSHGGLLSLMEATYYGVPTLTLPIFADQKMNGATLEQYDLGLSLFFADLTYEELSEKIKTILENPKYRENMKRRSMLFHDRPMKPMELAIYWTEFVAKYRDTSHLRVAALDLEWYQYLLLDVISLSAVILYSFCTIFYFTIKMIYRMFAREAKIKMN